MLSNVIKKNEGKWCHYAADGKLLGKFDTADAAGDHYDAVQVSAKTYAATLKGREVFRAGTHNGDKYTVADLDGMVSAFKELDFTPAIKIGHTQSGSEAYGYVENLHRTGDRLIADFTHMDDVTKEKIETRKLGRVSGEVYFNFKRDGKIYPRVLGAVALLGHEIPGVSSLKPLYADYVQMLENESDFKTYEYEVPTGEENRGNAEYTQQEEIRMAKTLEEMEKALAASQKLIQEQEAKLKTYGSEEAAMKKYEQDNAVLRNQVNSLREQSDKRAIAEKVAAVKIPALRDSFATLYSMAICRDTKVKHYSSVDKKESEVNLSEVLDQMVVHLNTKISGITKVYSIHDAPEDKPIVEDKVAAGNELDRLAKAYSLEHKVDYAAAITAVSRENPDLMKVYGT